MIKNVAQTLDLRRSKLTEGEIGVEIEVEGSNYFHPTKYWTLTHDGSLRNGAEYVLSKPLSMEDTKKALAYFSGCTKRYDMLINDSVRCAVHIHINVQQLNMVELANFITLYLIFEEVLTQYCGDSRDGNLFCLRTNDAEFIIQAMLDAFITRRFSQVFSSDDLRYASLNLNALTKFGSLEFRSKKTPTGKTAMIEVYDWIKILMKIKSKALQLNDPRDAVNMSSAQGPEAWIDEVFGEFSEVLKVGDWEERVRNGVVNAQDLAFCCDWGQFLLPSPVNPFKMGYG